MTLGQEDACKGPGSHLRLCEWSPRAGASPGMLTSVCHPHPRSISHQNQSSLPLSLHLHRPSACMGPHPSSDSPGTVAYTAPLLVPLVEQVLLSVSAPLAGSARWTLAPSCNPSPQCLSLSSSALGTQACVCLLPISPTRLPAGALLC